MATPQIRQFDTGPEAFAQLRGFVEHCCADAGIDPRTIAVLLLICEELFENSVQHGYRDTPGGASEQHIWLTLTVSGEGIDAIYEDAAPAYDPFAKVSPPDYSGPAETWRVGGLGIPLVTRLTRDLRYEHTGKRNRILFSVPVDGAAS